MCVRKINITAFITIIFVIFLATLALSSPDGAILEQPAVSPGYIQVRKGKNVEVNFILFDRIEYTGECPGLDISGAGRAQFTSSRTPPAPGRRVVIKNVTRGMNDDPYSYTDRQYYEGQYSEGFNFGLNSRHQGRRFSVLEGENKFTYEIKEKDNVIESGSFIAQVSVQNAAPKVRNKTCHQVRECRTDWSNSKPGATKENPKFELLLEPPEPFEIPKPSKPREICHWVTKCECP